MNAPTIKRRLEKTFILMTANNDLVEKIKAITPENWQCHHSVDLKTLGTWNEILLHRFMLLDLNEIDAFDPLDIISILRREYQVNIPVFCFGGDENLQQEMRMARADRFFSDEEIVDKTREFLEGWG